MSISIHAPPRGATPLCDGVAVGGKHFNSRPSARGDAYAADGQGERKDFNSRPSARGDLGCNAADNCRYISIHAPPRGATLPRDSFRQRDGISIHAPPRGATKVFRITSDARDIFQFTPLREGRRGSFAACAFHSNFNSRPSARGDKSSARKSSALRRFQFTPLREGRRRCNVASGIRGQFQFTPLREGRRTHMVRRLHLRRISIHAPPRGATRA